MNREKIVDIATKLPREAYIDLLCAGAKQLEDDWNCYNFWDLNPNMSKNQVRSLIEAFKEGKEEENE